MASRIVENTSKEKFEIGDLLKLTFEPTLYVLCTGITGGLFSGVVLHEEQTLHGVGHCSNAWCVEKFKKVSATIEFT